MKMVQDVGARRRRLELPTSYKEKNGSKRHMDNDEDEGSTSSVDELIQSFRRMAHKPAALNKDKASQNAQHKRTGSAVTPMPKLYQRPHPKPSFQLFPDSRSAIAEKRKRSRRVRNHQSGNSHVDEEDLEHLDDIISAPSPTKISSPMSKGGDSSPFHFSPLTRHQSTDGDSPAKQSIPHPSYADNPLRKKKVRLEDLVSCLSSVSDEKDADHSTDEFEIERAELKKEASMHFKPEPPRSSSKKIAEHVSSIQEAAKTIDEALLLALHPLSRYKNEAADNSHEDANLNNINVSLDVAVQDIANQLEAAFQFMTEQRHRDETIAHEKAEKEEAEALQEAKQNEKAKEEDALRSIQEQESVLKRIPLRGHLISGSADVDRALKRLELDEASVEQEIRYQREGNEESKADNSQMLMNFIKENNSKEEIDIMAKHLRTPPQSTTSFEKQYTIHEHPSQRIDWRQDIFEFAEGGNDRNYSATSAEEVGNNKWKETLEREVVGKLDLGILQLKHVLEIDIKEADEKRKAEKEKQRKIAEEQEKIRLLEEEEKIKLEECNRARTRVMGMSSLSESDWWREQSKALRRPQIVNNADFHDEVGEWSAPYNDYESAMVRFERIYEHAERKRVSKGSMNATNGSDNVNEESSGCKEKIFKASCDSSWRYPLSFSNENATEAFNPNRRGDKGSKRDWQVRPKHQSAMTKRSMSEIESTIKSLQSNRRHKKNWMQQTSYTKFPNTSS